MSISHTDIIIVFELCFWHCPWKDEHENNTPHAPRHAYLHVELQSKVVFCCNYWLVHSDWTVRNIYIVNCLSVCPIIYMFICLSLICLSVLSIYHSVCLSFFLLSSISLSRLWFYLSLHLSAVYLSYCFVYLSVLPVFHYFCLSLFYPSFCLSYILF